MKTPVVLAVILLTAMVSHAQNPNGALRGEVQDGTGARVPGALVKVEAAGSSMSRSEFPATWARRVPH